MLVILSMAVPDWIQTVLDWANAHRSLFAWLAGISLILGIAGLWLIPIAINRLPSSYFFELDRVARGELPPPPQRLGRLILQNFAGLLVFLAGSIMLAIPGQGLLTMFLGLCLMSFPGKRKVILSMVRRPTITKGLNWIRKKGKVKSLEIPEKS